MAPAIAAGLPRRAEAGAPDAAHGAARWSQLLVDAGLPEDWISVVTDSGKEAGGPLAEHAVPAVVTFTGSAPVGWAIAAAAPRKRVLLELGSNSPLLVQPDADLDGLATRIAKGGFGFAGQSCISIQRLLVHEDVHDELVEAVASAADELVVGDPLDETTDVGPLIKPREIDRVRDVGRRATVARGRARVVTGGARRTSGILRPTVVDERHAAPTAICAGKRCSGP
ncbi:MAG: aldehyde dehydrogenase family protein [Acidimicrobiia bacterium]|nr:aldehyde dehydrogenase family protein [Acidimicrobiia bacterium]